MCEGQKTAALHQKVPGIEGFWKFLPHRKAGRVWSKHEVGFEDCHEDGAVGNEQADARDDEEDNQSQEEAVLEGESHGHEELCLQQHLPWPDLE